MVEFSKKAKFACQNNVRRKVGLVMQQTVLQKAVTWAICVPASEFEEARAKLTLLQKNVELGEIASKNLLGIEQVAKKQLDNTLLGLRHERDQLSMLIACEERNYRQLSLKPLTWRNKDGLPLLGVFSLTSAEFKIEYKCVWGYSAEAKMSLCPTLPQPIWDCYEDVQQWCRRKVGNSGRAGVTAQFVGIIPNKVKTKIREAQSIFGNQIFLIAELKDLQVKVDPLVVGWDGKGLWLIDVFDITPIEDAMVETFPYAVKP